MRANAMVLVALLLGSLLTSLNSFSIATESHAPIVIDGDGGFAACSCVRSGTGTSADPYIISDWRIENPSGVGVVLRNLNTSHVKLLTNDIQARQPVVIDNVQSSVVVSSNTLRPSSNAALSVVQVSLSRDISILSNTMANPFGWVSTYNGVKVDRSLATIQGNAINRFSKAVYATQATVTVASNVLNENRDAIVLDDSVNGVVENNTINLNLNWGITINRGSVVTVAGNTMTEGFGGVQVTSSSLTMTGNVVTNQKAEAVKFASSVVTMAGNTIRDNWAGAVGASSSNMQITNNLIQNNRFVGIRLTGAEGSVVANQIHDNGLPEDGGGIALESSIIELRDNVLNGNGYGISVPYSSRQSIALMVGNVVNGINVDGTTVPAEKVLYYRVVSTSVSGRLFDNNHASGFFGVLIKEANLVIYDSSDIVVHNNTFKYGLRGILIEASQRITVRDNIFLDNTIAVEATQSRVFIKENDCDISIDPPATVCFAVRGGHAEIRFNLIAHVSIGILIQQGAGVSATGTIEGNLIVETGTGIRAERVTQRLDLIIKANTVQRARVGLALVDFSGSLESNVVVDGDVGIHLLGGGNATLTSDLIARNRIGLDDPDCASTSNAGCSGIDMKNVTIQANLQFGARVGSGRFRWIISEDNGHSGELLGKGQGLLLLRGGAVAHSTFRANVGVGLEVHGHATIRNVTASANVRAGIQVNGTAELQAVASLNNTGSGAVLIGAGVVTGGNFSGNADAGLDLRGSLFYATRCRAHANLDGVRLGEIPPDVNIQIDIQAIIQIIINLMPEPNQPDKNDPLFMAECRITANADHALEVSVNGFADARRNFWGAAGPVFDVGLGGRNTIQGTAVVSPYYKDDALTELGVVPGVSPITDAPGV